MTAVRVVDSSAPPTAAQVAQAKAAGAGAWFGYLGKAGDNLLRPWTQADFDVITAGGLLTGAYCSGQDDPAWVRSTADAWGLHVVVLDDEAGIKADGTWVSGWCQTARAGLYGDGAVLRPHIDDPTIPFFVLSAYPGTGSQSATWSTSEAGCATTKPTGWQWAGTVPMFGTTVDEANYDQRIFGPLDDQEDHMLIGDVNPDGSGGAICLVAGNKPAIVLTAAQMQNIINRRKDQGCAPPFIDWDHDLFEYYMAPSPQPSTSGTVSGTLTIS